MRAVDLLLHPVRLRIAQAFLGDRVLTTGQLSAELPEIAPATLYRQVAALADGCVLEVVDERRVRGAIERRYRLRSGAASVDADEAATMTTDEHRRAFLTFVASLLADFDSYLSAGDDVDLGRDQVGYRQVALHLTADELASLLEDLRAAVASRLTLPAAPERRRHVLTTVLLPTDDQRPSPDDPGKGL